MNKVVLALGLLLSVVAFAGPEDHIQNQVCYNLSEDQLKLANQHIPLQVCLESLTIDPQTQTVDVYSYFMPQLFKGLKAEKFIRVTEDQYKFTAVGYLHDEWSSGCGYGEIVKLSIAGLTDFLGVGSIDQLEVRVEQETSNDTCHSYPQINEFIYKK